jgi:hypothetical protein
VDPNSLDSETFDRMAKSAVEIGHRLHRPHSLEGVQAARSVPGELRGCARAAWLTQFLCFPYKERGYKELVYQVHDLLSRGLDCDCLDALRQYLKNPSRSLLERFEADVLGLRLFVQVREITVVSSGLLSPDWLISAKTPREFNRELGSQLSHLRTAMKRLYGVQSHRTSTNINRDREIWLLHRQKRKLTWGQVGQKFKISDGAAEQAYKRHAKREKRRLVDFEKIVETMHRLYESRNKPEETSTNPFLSMIKAIDLWGPLQSFPMEDFNAIQAVIRSYTAEHPEVLEGVAPA